MLISEVTPSKRSLSCKALAGMEMSREIQELKEGMLGLKHVCAGVFLECVACYFDADISLPSSENNLFFRFPLHNSVFSKQRESDVPGVNALGGFLLGIQKFTAPRK